MDFDYANYMVTGGRKIKRTPIPRSVSSDAYQKLIAETLGMNRTRILAFKNKPPVPVESIPKDFTDPADPVRPPKPLRYIPKAPRKILAAPDIVDDPFLNLLDWGSGNLLSIALENTVYLWDASNGTTSEFVTVDEEKGPVTSLKWAADGHRLCVGLNNSEVQLWDSRDDKLLRTLRGGHRLCVSSLDWNSEILTTGGMEGKIINHDVRVRGHIVKTYQGHHGGVCGLKWSGSGQQLASGGNDSLLHIWDRSMASCVAQKQWLHRLEDHTSAVNALAWYPFQHNILASGGGESDNCIKFWNTSTGACLNSVDTGSAVSALLWNNNERELLSSHGFTSNQFTLWKYPSMLKIVDLTAHTSRVLFMAKSPDGCSVAAAAGDEKLIIWDVFGAPEVAKPSKKTNREPFSYLNSVR